MLEHEGALLTWQLLREPFCPIDPPIAARHIGNHRLAYLDYEGPISRNRGEVRRVDKGTLAFESREDDRIIFTLDSVRMRGRFVLERHDDSWLLGHAE